MNFLKFLTVKFFILGTNDVMDRFEFAHHNMQLTHKDLLLYPEIFQTRLFKLKQRHDFLVHLGRNQYDPKLELYVSPSALVTSSNREFVENIAKSCMEEYDKFLKTQ